MSKMGISLERRVVSSINVVNYNISGTRRRLSLDLILVKLPWSIA